MGCLSYICKFCGKSIKSDSETGEGVKLFLLQEGQLLEEKEGNYNSYGSVFKSIKWENDWGSIVEKHFNNSKKDGIAAIHSQCWNEKQNPQIPTTISENDRNQGWGKMKKSQTDIVNSKFYSLINKKTLQEKDEKLEKLNNHLNKLLKEGETLLKHLKDKEKK